MGFLIIILFNFFFLSFLILIIPCFFPFFFSFLFFLSFFPFFFSFLFPFCFFPYFFPFLFGELKKKKKKMRFIFIFSLFILAHAQNNNNLPNLKIIWIDWDPCYQLGELSQDFEGATFETTCVSPNDWHSVIWDQWGDENGYDIVILDSQWMGEGSEHLVDISNFMNNELDLDDFYPIPLSAYGEYPPQSGVYYGAPLFADVQFLVYRKDVFESLGIRDVFSLSNLIDVAEQIKEARKDVDGMWGFASFYCGNATICYDELATVFNQFAWNQGGEIWDETQYRVKGVL